MNKNKRLKEIYIAYFIHNLKNYYLIVLFTYWLIDLVISFSIDEKPHILSFGMFLFPLYIILLFSFLFLPPNKYWKVRTRELSENEICELTLFISNFKLDQYEVRKSKTTTEFIYKNKILGSQVLEIELSQIVRAVGPNHMLNPFIEFFENNNIEYESN